MAKAGHDPYCTGIVRVSSCGDLAGLKVINLLDTTSDNIPRFIHGLKFMTNLAGHIVLTNKDLKHHQC